MNANGKMAKLSTSVSSTYWKIPFYPQREQMIADHGIIIKRQSNVENEEDAAIPSKKEVTSHPDYWEIRKIIRLIQIGDPTATVLMLCALKELDFLQTASGSEIIRHLDGVSLFLNIIETDDDRCKMAALKVLVTLARSTKSSETILRKKGMQLFVLILRTEKNKTVLSLVCEVITSMAKHSYATRFLKELKVVEILMTVFKDCAKHKRQSENLKLFHSVCYAVWSCCLSGRKEDAIAVSECLGVITRLVRTKDDGQVRPLLGIIEACCDVLYFRRQLDGENLVGELISKMKSTEAIKILSLKILYKCASDERFQKTFTKSNHLQDIVILLKKNCKERESVETLTLLLGFVWKCCLNEEHRTRFIDEGIFPNILNIIKEDRCVEVKAIALGLMSDLLSGNVFTNVIHDSDLVTKLIDFLSETESLLLMNSARCLGVCAVDKTFRTQIIKQDGLRLLWSMLKSSNKKVVATGAVSLASVCSKPEESAIAVRSIVGGLELLMTLLHHTTLDETNLLVCLCEVTMNIAADAENRSILIDYQLIPVLLRLFESEDEALQYYVACLVQRCCASLKERGVVTRCVSFLIRKLDKEHEDHTRCASICALNELSRDRRNCVFLRSSKATKILINLLSSSNEKIQEAAAECLCNIRKSFQ